MIDDDEADVMDSGTMEMDDIEGSDFEAPAFEDSVSGTPNPVECRDDLPGDIFLSAEMSPEDQAALLK